MPSRRMIILGGLGTAGALSSATHCGPATGSARRQARGQAGRALRRQLDQDRPDNSVTVVVPHCDMGTGIFTALPQMAAEELDADWSTVRVEAAPPIRCSPMAR
jgi:isoquinoline 1-oxidoreductase beta subunit